MRTVGAPLAAAVPRVCQAAPAALVDAYVPIFSAMTTGPNRVIGFAQVDFVRANCPANARVVTFNATITRRVPTVAARNATAMVSETVPTVAPVLMTELLQKNLVAAGRPNYGPVLVPVLAR
jgi:hypothetical protein